MPKKIRKRQLLRLSSKDQFINLLFLETIKCKSQKLDKKAKEMQEKGSQEKAKKKLDY